MPEKSAARASRVRKLKDAGVFSSAAAVNLQGAENARQGQQDAKSHMTGMGPGDGSTSGEDLTPDEIEFGKAMDDYKKRTGRKFPSWSEALGVLRELGYHR